MQINKIHNKDTDAITTLSALHPNSLCHPLMSEPLHVNCGLTQAPNEGCFINGAVIRLPAGGQAPSISVLTMKEEERVQPIKRLSSNSPLVHSLSRGMKVVGIFYETMVLLWCLIPLLRTLCFSVCRIVPKTTIPIVLLNLVQHEQRRNTHVGTHPCNSILLHAVGGGLSTGSHRIQPPHLQPKLSQHLQPFKSNTDKPINFLDI